MDTALPFGLLSATIILIFGSGRRFAVGDVAAGCPGRCPVFLGLSKQRGGRAQPQWTLGTCEKLEVPVAVQKLKGPSTCLTFLGLELDTKTQEIRMPEEKLERVRGLIRR